METARVCPPHCAVVVSIGDLADLVVVGGWRAGSARAVATANV